MYSSAAWRRRRISARAGGSGGRKWATKSLVSAYAVGGIRGMKGKIRHLLARYRDYACHQATKAKAAPPGLSSTSTGGISVKIIAVMYNGSSSGRLEPCVGLREKPRLRNTGVYTLHPRRENIEGRNDWRPITTHRWRPVLYHGSSANICVTVAQSIGYCPRPGLLLSALSWLAAAGHFCGMRNPAPRPGWPGLCGLWPIYVGAYQLSSLALGIAKRKLRSGTSARR